MCLNSYFTGDADFSDELIPVVFGSGDTEKCADIPILQDEEDEEEEEFQVSLLRLNDEGEPQRINGTGSLPVFIRGKYVHCMCTHSHTDRHTHTCLLQTN